VLASPQRASHSLAEAYALAARLVAVVLEGGSLTEAFDSLWRRERDVTASLRAAVRDLAFNTLRAYGIVDRAVALLAERPPKPLLRALLMVAVLELRAARAAPYAIVDQAVAASEALAGERARAFVNAVLRNYQRRIAEIDAAIAASDEGRYQHPQWWIDLLRQAWPAQWERILAAGNGHPPMTLRVNTRVNATNDYLATLEHAGIAARLVGDTALRLERPLPVDLLPGFREGKVSVQDAGAQRAAEFLDARDGMRVLDACAAPGGKAAHILERADVALTAVEVDGARADRIRENLARLKLDATILVADAARTQDWWDGRKFDRILLDVPCSASGVVRRHPDIKWLRRAQDIPRFAETQRRMLEAVWPLLAPGGRMLYATCSVFPAENAQTIGAFLARHPEAHPEPLPGTIDGSILPDADRDGFYYALIEHRS